MSQSGCGDSGLLDYLAAECGCTYLSDLRVPETVTSLTLTLKRIPRGAWPAAAWKEAASYVTGAQDIPATEDGARAALARFIQTK